MAAEILAQAGHAVTVYERKPSLGRKFLMAGRGGLNLTHSEPLDAFLTRYGPAAQALSPCIHRFPPDALRAWCEGLGQETFVGSSGRVFPKAFKASPLLRSWIARLDGLGVRFAMSREWTGWDSSGALAFRAPDGAIETARPAAVLLALGGASWPKLGSDGGWVPLLAARGVPVAPLRPANCGFVVPWSPVFRDKFAGTPLKTITLTFAGKTVPGEIMIAENGIEGGAVYALSAALRDHVLEQGSAVVQIDLRPGLSRESLLEKLSAPRGGQSFSTWMQKAAGLAPVAISLLRETDPGIAAKTPDALAGAIKSLPLRVIAPFPIDRAISTAGGIALTALDGNFMLTDLRPALPRVSAPPTG
ncbi:MAG: TIGR03862 family flavoprotein [Micavibrio aeruginosavorus]|nr:TIGR03862 family flavoprotein [Micavibrio aeruginosavorus]